MDSLMQIKAVFIWSKYRKKLYFEILLQFLILVSCFNTLKYNLFLWSKLNSQHHYSSLQCHTIFRNHSNMLIYYECWNSSYCFLEHVILLFDSSMNTKLKRTAFVQNKKFFSQYKSLLSPFIHLTHPSEIKVLLSFKKNTKIQTQNFLIVVHIETQNVYFE